MSALLQGRAQQDTGKQKTSPSKRGSTDIYRGGGGECECLSVRLHAAFSPGVDNLSRQRWGEKQANMSEQRCATSEEGYWGLLIYTHWRDHRTSRFTVLPVIAVQLWEIWKCRMLATVTHNTAACQRIRCRVYLWKCYKQTAVADSGWQTDLIQAFPKINEHGFWDLVKEFML